MPNRNSILFLLPAPFVQKPDEPGFQVQTRNFRTTFGFVVPELIDRGFSVELVSLSNTPRQKENGVEFLQTSGLGKNCRAFFFKRSMGRGRIIPQFLQFLINILYLAPRLSKCSIVYGYNDVGTLYGAVLKPFFRYRLVYDMRGNRSNEMAVQGAPKWRITLYRRIKNFCLHKSDLVFTVSKHCEDIPKGKKHLSKYNFYDARHFFYDRAMAGQMREELGLGDRFVFVYSGTDKYYQMVPQMVRFFAGFLKICPDAYFMINVPVPSRKFEKALETNNIPRSAWGMFHLDQRNLNRYQMVADMAFLIREDLPLNHEAFPTKFSEYLASGVPVLITRHVHTLAEMVEKNGLGEIWEEDESEQEVQKRILTYHSNNEVRERCAAFARENLSWQTKAVWLADALSDLNPG
ncbi:glycosyltransferase [Anaerophaga thermohalophila]|uniref:glycosyltransferase n=1 Tax=Anaerophaga thermohalophila TaxID=177400 RepID=UPI000237CE2B|nr:glycosyltransferase [Anaerophaga thermohalophila]